MQIGFNMENVHQKELFDYYHKQLQEKMKDRYKEIIEGEKNDKR